jgi:hypothetical protein
MALNGRGFCSERLGTEISYQTGISAATAYIVPPGIHIIRPASY